MYAENRVSLQDFPPISKNYEDTHTEQDLSTDEQAEREEWRDGSCNDILLKVLSCNSGCLDGGVAACIRAASTRQAQVPELRRRIRDLLV